MAENSAVSERVPHGRLGSVEITLAPAVSRDHPPPGATIGIPGTLGRVHVTLSSRSSKAYQIHFLKVELFEIGNSRPRAGWSVNLPHGQRHSVLFDMKKLGLEPGNYRIVISEGAARVQVAFDLLSQHPRAIDVTDRAGEDIAIANSDWATRDGYADWPVWASPRNIALAVLGGRIGASEHAIPSWANEHLNDGQGVVFAPLPNNDECLVCGWSVAEKSNDWNISVSFRDGQAAFVSGVVLDTRVHPWNASYAGNFPKVVEIYGTPVAAGTESVRIATSYLARRAGKFLIPLPIGPQYSNLRIRIADTHNRGGPVLVELSVLEGGAAKASILRDLRIDLAAAGLGGTLVVSDRSDDTLPSALFDGDAGDDFWASADGGFPQDFTIAFARDARVLIEALRLTAPRDAPSATWPSEVSVELSNDSPLEGFREVGRFLVEKTSREQVFPIGAAGRFARVRILDNHGASRTSLARLSLIEGRAPGYTPLLFREEGETWRATIEPGDAEQLGAPTEVEPNDDQPQASPLVFGSETIGRIMPLGEADVFALPQRLGDTHSVTIALRGEPTIRQRLEIIDQKGTTLSTLEPNTLTANFARLTFLLGPDASHIRLTEPASSVVVIWDESGSMKGRERDLERAVRGYIRQAPEGQMIHLVRFSREVDVLTSRFQSSKPALNAAMRTPNLSGYTSFYDAVDRGLDLLSGRKGNHAIIILSDGEDTSSRISQIDLWRRLERQKTRIYSIGLGERMKNYSATIGSTGQRQLEHLAGATGGSAFFGANSSELRNFYAEIAEELSTPATDSITPFLEPGTGTVKLRATGESIPAAALPAYHVIFDVSGSMNERLASGDRKIAVARKALNALLGQLPEGAPLSLTVYGDRVRESEGLTKACADIRTVQDLAPLERRKLMEEVAALKPVGGTTPLLAAIEAVSESIVPGRVSRLVVITDGVEHCETDRWENISSRFPGYVDALKQRGIEMTMSIVGFDIETDDAVETLRGLAATAGGSFFDARNQNDLTRDVAMAAAAKFVIRDAAGEPVAEGQINGPALTLSAGRYAVELQTAAGPKRRGGVSIKDGELTIVDVNKVGDAFNISIGAPLSPVAQRRARNRCGEAALKAEEQHRVRKVQTLLNRLGHSVGAVDGQWGPNSDRAARGFARAKGVEAAKGPTTRLLRHLLCVSETGEPWPGPGETVIGSPSDAARVDE